MTTKERQLFEELRTMQGELHSLISRYQEATDARVTEIKTRVDKKHIPVNMEQDIIRAINNSMSKAIEEVASGYNSPLRNYINEVIEDNQEAIKKRLQINITEAMNTNEFDVLIRKSLKEKIAKGLISGVYKSVDKITDELKQHPEFNAKLKLLVIDLVNRFTVETGEQAME